MEKKKLIRNVLKVEDETLNEDQMIRDLLGQKVLEQLSAREEKLSFGQKAADAVAKFAGSWAFIISFIIVMSLWIAGNILLALKAFDPYPFILLNLMLSCLAAVQAPLIMMSQNRQEEKDRRRGENDYRVNLKDELLTAEIYRDTKRLLTQQAKIMKTLNIIETTGEMDTSAIEHRIDETAEQEKSQKNDASLKQTDAIPSEQTKTEN